MKKLSALLVVLVICLTALSASLADGLQSDPLALPTDRPGTGLPEGYDPASEEDSLSYYASGSAYNDYGRSLYAGASPIPLDPIDMPTPTPKPQLTFSYGPVTASKIGVSFEGPAGWILDTSADDSVVLTNPTAYDGYNATITVRIYPVASSFKLSDVRTELKNTLKELGQFNFAKWNHTELAARTLLKKDGFYADYDGAYYNGTAIHGRVMMALLDGNKIIMLHLSCPDGFFNSSYKSVINHVRETMKQL